MNSKNIQIIMVLSFVILLTANVFATEYSCSEYKTKILDKLATVKTMVDSRVDLKNNTQITALLTSIMTSTNKKYNDAGCNSTQKFNLTININCSDTCTFNQGAVTVKKGTFSESKPITTNKIYTFENLDKGTYDINISTNGYDDYIVTNHPDTQTQLSVNLQKSNANATNNGSSTLNPPVVTIAENSNLITIQNSQSATSKIYYKIVNLSTDPTAYTAYDGPMALINITSSMNNYTIYAHICLKTDATTCSADTVKAIGYTSATNNSAPTTPIIALELINGSDGRITIASTTPGATIKYKIAQPSMIDATAYQNYTGPIAVNAFANSTPEGWDIVKAKACIGDVCSIETSSPVYQSTTGNNSTGDIRILLPQWDSQQLGVECNRLEFPDVICTCMGSTLGYKFCGIISSENENGEWVWMHAYIENAVKEGDIQANACLDSTKYRCN